MNQTQPISSTKCQDSEALTWDTIDGLDDEKPEWSMAWIKADHSIFGRDAVCCCRGPNLIHFIGRCHWELQRNTRILWLQIYFFFQMFPLIKKVSWEVSDFCRFGVEKDTLLDLLESCSSFARLILKVWPSKDHRLKVGTRICSVWGTDEGSKHEGALALPRMVKQMHRTNAKTKELWYSYYFVFGSSYILKIS